LEHIEIAVLQLREVRVGIQDLGKERRRNLEYLDLGLERGDRHPVEREHEQGEQEQRQNA
jgi:hypothetical protein